MKVTLNLIKHINFSLFHTLENDEDLNAHIEHCDEYLNDQLLIDYAKEMGINY